MTAPHSPAALVAAEEANVQDLSRRSVLFPPSLDAKRRETHGSASADDESQRLQRKIRWILGWDRPPAKSWSEPSPHSKAHATGFACGQDFGVLP